MASPLGGGGAAAAFQAVQRFARHLPGQKGLRVFQHILADEDHDGRSIGHLGEGWTSVD